MPLDHHTLVKKIDACTSFTPAHLDFFIQEIIGETEGSSADHIKAYFLSLMQEGAQTSIPTYFSNPIGLGESFLCTKSGLSISLAVYHALLLYGLFRQNPNRPIPALFSPAYTELFNTEIEPGLTPLTIHSWPETKKLLAYLLEEKKKIDAQSFTNQSHQESLILDFFDVDAEEQRLAECVNLPPKAFIYHVGDGGLENYINLQLQNHIQALPACESNTIKLFLLRISIYNPTFLKQYLDEEYYPEWIKLIHLGLNPKILSPQGIAGYLVLTKKGIHVDTYMSSEALQNHIGYVAQSAENPSTLLTEFTRNPDSAASLFVAGFRRFTQTTATFEQISTWLKKSLFLPENDTEVLLPYIEKNIYLNTTQAFIVHCARFSTEEYQNISASEWGLLEKFAPFEKTQAQSITPDDLGLSIRDFLSYLRKPEKNPQAEYFIETLSKTKNGIFDWTGSYINFKFFTGITHPEVLNLSEPILNILKRAQWEPISGETEFFAFAKSLINCGSFAENYEKTPKKHLLKDLRDLVLLDSIVLTNKTKTPELACVHDILRKKYHKIETLYSLEILCARIYKIVASNLSRGYSMNDLASSSENLVSELSALIRKEIHPEIIDLFLRLYDSSKIYEIYQYSEALRYFIGLYVNHINPNHAAIISLYRSIMPSEEQIGIGLLTKEQVFNLFEDICNNIDKHYDIIKRFAKNELTIDDFYLYFNNHTEFKEDYSFDDIQRFYKKIFEQNPDIKPVFLELLKSNESQNLSEIIKLQSNKIEYMQSVLASYSYFKKMNCITDSKKDLLVVFEHVATCGDQVLDLYSDLELQRLMAFYSVETGSQYKMRTHSMAMRLAKKLGVTYCSEKSKQIPCIANLSPRSTALMLENINKKFGFSYKNVLNDGLTEEEISWIFNDAMIAYKPEKAVELFHSLNSETKIKIMELLKHQPNHNFTEIIYKNNNVDPFLVLKENIESDVFFGVWKAYNAGISPALNFMVSHFKYKAVDSKILLFLMNMEKKDSVIIHNFIKNVLLEKNQNESSKNILEFLKKLSDLEPESLQAFLNSFAALQQSGVYTDFYKAWDIATEIPGLPNLLKDHFNPNYQLFAALGTQKTQKLYDYLQQETDIVCQQELLQKISVFFFGLTPLAKDAFVRSLASAELKPEALQEMRYTSFIKALGFNQKPIQRSFASLNLNENTDFSSDSEEESAENTETSRNNRAKI